MTDYTRNSPPRRSGIEHRINLLLVFSVTPFKLNQNQNQNSSNDKVQNLEEKEGKYAKTFTKIQVTAMFLTQDMRRAKFPEIPGRRGTPRKIGRGCAARFPKPLPYL